MVEILKKGLYYIYCKESEEMKDKITRLLIGSVCDDFIDTLLVGIEEYNSDFPYTIACVNFICELKSKNINADFNDIFVDMVRDKIYKETSNYLAR